VQLVDESTYDVIRDLTCTLGLSLVRMEERRHRIEEVFQDPGRHGRHAQQEPVRVGPA
jgi:ABC-2 type transport system ATP-binding protein